MCQTPGSGQRCEQRDGLLTYRLVWSINISHTGTKEEHKTEMLKKCSIMNQDK